MAGAERGPEASHLPGPLGGHNLPDFPRRVGLVHQPTVIQRQQYNVKKFRTFAAMDRVKVGLAVPLLASVTNPQCRPIREVDRTFRCRR